jgi:large subunit ribosomal protein L30e
MSLTETLQSALKAGKAILGFRRSIKFIKSSKPKLIIVANNLPGRMREEIEYNARLLGVEVKVFEGDSKELGVVCGKPFPITTIAIRR